jgi:hypothetical protein
VNPWSHLSFQCISLHQPLVVQLERACISSKFAERLALDPDPTCPHAAAIQNKIPNRP